MSEDLKQKLINVQKNLRAAKNQKNNYGKYNYRSCEDILEAVKPLLHEQGLLLTITDDMCEVGGRVYVRASAAIQDGDNIIKALAFAREPENKKGMDESQITGAASSYARKYALNGLFLIDDNKDADTMPPPVKEPAKEVAKKPDKKPATEAEIIAFFDGCTNEVTLAKYHASWKKNAEHCSSTYIEQAYEKKRMKFRAEAEAIKEEIKSKRTTL